MNYKKLGSTDIDVSTICLGTMTWGEQNSKADGFEQMDYAIDNGVNFWDTAEIYAIPMREETYGETENIIGEWFKKSYKVFDKNYDFNNVNANVKNSPANKNDLDLYHGMGVSFLCNATRKGFDLDFPKTLNVASATFASVVSQKHGGKIIEKKKEQKVDMKQLQFIASLQLVESALQVCPDNVPEKIEKQFKIETERLKKLQGL